MHDKPVTQVHFHEVGAMDAVADIVGVCMAMEQLAPERVVVSPIHVGSGQVRCAHGVLPVPAPATALILQGVPIYSGSIRGELCTPTGAALLKHFANSFSAMPTMTTERIGYGMGKKDFEAANCVRVILGDSFSGKASTTEQRGDEVSELSCNLDDMTPEAIGYCMDILINSGALDVYTVPIGMKKSRPGVMLVCLCYKDRAEDMAKLMLTHTTTLGIREHSCRRYTLDRRVDSVNTPYGNVRVKTSFGYSITKSKPEYDDMAAIAKEQGIPLETVRKAVDKALLLG